MGTIKKIPVQKEPEHGEDDVNQQWLTPWYCQDQKKYEDIPPSCFPSLDVVPVGVVPIDNPYPGIQIANIANMPKADPIWIAALVNSDKTTYVTPTPIDDPIAFCFDDNIDACTRFNAMFSYETIYGGKLVELNSCDDVNAAFGETTSSVFEDETFLEDLNTCATDDAIDYGTMEDLADRKVGLRDPLAPKE